MPSTALSTSAAGARRTLTSCLVRPRGLLGTSATPRCRTVLRGFVHAFPDEVVDGEEVGLLATLPIERLVEEPRRVELIQVVDLDNDAMRDELLNELPGAGRDMGVRQCPALRDARQPDPVADAEVAPGLVFDRGVRVAHGVERTSTTPRSHVVDPRGAGDFQRISRPDPHRHSGSGCYGAAVPSPAAMRRVLVALLLLVGLLALAFLCAPGSEDGAVVVRAEGADVAPSMASCSPVPEDRRASPRLQGAHNARADGVDPETPTAAEPSASVCAPRAIARLLHEGTRVERLWGHHVLERATPAQRRKIGQSMETRGTTERVTAKEVDGPTSRVRIELRIRLVRARAGLLWDLGINTVGMGGPGTLRTEGPCIPVLLDDAEIEALERLIPQGGSGIQVEDEGWLRRASGERGLVILDAVDSSQAEARPPVLPLGATVRATPVVSEDRRFVTVEILARVAVAATTKESEDSVGGIVLRALGPSTFAIPVGGATVLMDVEGLLWLPRGAPHPETGTNLILMQAYVP